MSEYWAVWDDQICPGYLVRRHTRIYWSPQTGIVPGRCIGTFIGENPGGGRPLCSSTLPDAQPIVCKGRVGDPTLRLLKDVWRAAVHRRRLNPPCSTDYLQILNLYYFASGIANQLFPNWNNAGGSNIYFELPHKSTGFVILGWGQRLNTSQQAQRLLGAIPPKTDVVIPALNVLQMPATIAANLVFPLTPYPVQPSAAIQRGIGVSKTYTTAIAKCL
jgi:hypothetical protein